MKKCIALILAVLLLLTVSVSCGQSEPEARTVSLSIGGQEMTVTFEPGNLSAGTARADNGTYTFAWDNSGDLNITYPDGSRCTYWSSGTAGGLSASVDFHPEAKGYPSGITMAWGIESAVEQVRPRRSSDGPNPLLAILLLALGAWNAFAPRAAWYLSHGWRYKDAEPSDAALTMHVLGGGLLIFIGVICLLAAIF